MLMVEMDNKIEINGSLYKSIQDYCNQNDIKKEDFNEPVKIIEDVKYCSYMFWNCYSFNQPVIIPEGVTDCENMFYNCISLNQPIILPKNIKNINGMFLNCLDFNQPITIPHSATDCCSMFENCRSFNQPIDIPNGVIDCQGMFKGCTAFTHPLTIPSSVLNGKGIIEYIFHDIPITVNLNKLYFFYKEITIENKLFGKLTISTNILYKCDELKRKISFHLSQRSLSICVSEEEFAEISLLALLN